MTAKRTPPPLWIAAEARGPDWTFWAMSGDSVKEQQQARLEHGTDDPGFEATYLQLCTALGGPTDIPLIVSGLGRIAHVPVPTRPEACLPVALSMDGSAGTVPAATELLAVPGLSQTSPPAVMRYEAMRISGFLSLNRSWEGVICLPGATTHWALISADEVVSFQSFLTTSMVETAFARAGLQADHWRPQTLEDTVADTISRPELTAARLAEALADQALNGAEALDTAGKIWGALLGAELAAARPYWLGQNLALIGAQEHAAPYATALKAQGLSVTVADAERMSLAGLTRVWRQLAD
ncbi:2-dehydro-3-deoxygalactonokinase [Phycobacter sp. K97]|uniref:2-dehydro-3-deoxygalactonokinase n=1 Tax=Phycobacter sedimenti TaxID=3133977 RepID=UPI00311D6DEA